MSSVPQGLRPANGTRSVLVGFVLAALLAFAYMATAAAEDASARDIVISDSSSPLSAGTGSAFGDATAPQAGSPAATQSGSCTTPNVSIRPSAAGATTAASTQLALAKAFNPASLGVQTGDSVLFCNIASGTPANTYEPAEAGTSGTSIDLSVTPSITIAAFPGQTPALEANFDDGASPGNFNFFSDTSTQGRTFTLSNLILRQDQTVTSTQNGGFMRVSNAVNPGTLNLNNITATGFATDGAGGVIAAENVNINTATLGTAVNNTTGPNGTPDYGNPAQSNSAEAGGGAIYAEGNVTVTGLNANNNNVADDGGAGAGSGGAILAAGLNGASSGNVTLSGAVSNFQKNRNLDLTAGAGNGGAIAATGIVAISNASVFGGVPVTTPAPNNLGGNSSLTGAGGAIAAGYVVAGPDVSFVANSAGAAGGAIYAGGVQHDGGGDAAVEFAANSAAGGGAIAIAGNFSGAGTAADPRVCSVPTVLTNTNFGNGTDAAANVATTLGGGAVHVLDTATDNAATGPETPNTIKKCAVNLSGTDFNGNRATTGGGGAVLAAGGAISASATTQFRNNDAGNTGTLATPTWGAGSGGAIRSTATRETTITVPATVFTANQAGEDGGAVSVQGSSTSTFTGSTFTNNNAANRLAAANDRGGAIVAQPVGTPAVAISGATFTGNSVAANVAGDLDTAGAVSLLAGTSSITESGFTNNNAGTLGSGGAVQIGNNASVTKSTFTTNKAGTTSGNGGAILVTGGTPVIEENDFLQNTATGGTAPFGNGGAIASIVALGVAPGSLSENEFLGNGASATGGAVAHSTAGNLTISDSVFGQNYAVGGGGAVASSSGTLTITDAEFGLNGSQGDGGAVAAAGTDTILDNTEFVNNKAGVSSAGAYVTAGNASDGGAVKIGSATYLIDESIFVGNEAANNGGAVDAASNGAGAGDGILLSGFGENEAGKANAAQASTGGAVNLSTAAQNIVDSEFVDNAVAQTNTGAAAVTRGGAVAATGGNLAIDDSTIAGNSVSSAAAVTAPAIAAAGGGVYMASANTVTATNSTFTGNNAPVASVAWLEGNSTLTFASSTIAGNGGPLAAPMIVAGSTTGTLVIGNSILAQGVGAGSACTANTLTNGGGNVLTDTTACGTNAFVGGGGAPAAKVTAAALDLKALADNGGPTDTMALGLGSVARGSVTGARPAADQRGLARPTAPAPASSGAYQLTIDTLTVSKAGAGAGTVASNPAGIDCGPGCQTQTGEFAETPPATLVTLTATPEAGSEFQSWTGNCVEISGNTCVVNLGVANNITANFASNLRNLTVSRVGNGEGKVTSSPAGIDCGTACEANFDLGTVVTLTAEAQGQSAFNGWGGACAAAGLAATCQVTMDEARSVTANFTQNASVQIAKINSGTIRVPGNRTISVGRVTCVNGTCNISQATARVRVRGVTYRASVKGQSGSFTTGQSRTVKVVVPKAAYRNLTNRKSGSVTLVLRAEASLPGSTMERNRNISNGLRR